MPDEQEERIARRVVELLNEDRGEGLVERLMPAEDGTVTSTQLGMYIAIPILAGILSLAIINPRQNLPRNYQGVQRQYEQDPKYQDLRKHGFSHDEALDFLRRR